MISRKDESSQSCFLRVFWKYMLLLSWALELSRQKDIWV